MSIDSRHYSVNACLAPLGTLHNKHVLTIEGLGTVNHLHPAQKVIAEQYGSQCGFCTPGIVMSLFAFAKNHPKATIHEMEEAFDGSFKKTYFS